MPRTLNPLDLQLDFLLPALIMGLFLAIVGLPQIHTMYTLWHPGRDIVFNDFMIHWEAARLVAAGRAAEVYDRAAMTAGLVADFGLGQTVYRDGAMAWSYFYPPTGLLLIWPLGWMDYPVAALAMVGGGLAGYLLLVWRLGRGTGLLFVLGSPALWICLLGGQNSFLLAAFLGFSILFSSSRRMIAAGMIALCSFKPPFIAVLPFVLAASRQFRVLVWAGTGSVAFASCALFVFGFPVWQSYWQYGVPDAGGMLCNSQVWPGMISVFASLSMLGLSCTSALVLHGVLSLVVVAGAVWLFRVTDNINLRLGGVMMAAILIPPMAYDYDMPMAMIAVLCVLRDGLRQKSGRMETGIMLAIFFLPHLFHAGAATVLGFSMIPLANLGLFFCILRRAAFTGKALFAPGHAVG